MREIRRLGLFLALLLLAPSIAGAAPAEIRILHVNDFHGFALPHRPVGSEVPLGGIAALAAAAKRLRAEKPALLLAAGDMIQGHAVANLFEGKPVVEIMNAMRFDAMALGNHEFDFGQETLKKRIEEAEFPVLAANVEGFAPSKPYAVFPVGGVSVAVIGVVTADTPVTTHPRNVAGLAFLPPEEAVERCLKEVRGRADVVVVLSHLGFAADRTLAEKVRGIDVIVGGHSHTKVERPARIGGTIVVQAWEHGKALGVLDLSVEGGKVTGVSGRLVEIVAGRGGEDEEVGRIVAVYRGKMDAVLDGKIGETPVDLDGENVRARETNLGDFLADAIRKTARADAALINGGAIRTGIRKGAIRLRDVYSVLPFENYIVALRLTGAQIREALEHGVSAPEEGAGRFPQVSGLAFRYRRSAPPGSRVLEIRIGGRPIDAAREYTVATLDFLAVGGDGYRAFGDALRSSRDYSSVGGVLRGEKMVYSDPGRWVRDVVRAEISGGAVFSVLPEGRIVLEE
jgi:2',3'-cyclic-nucleotide 2'-phosphodiesterase (5'-nucleotidase family)